MKKFLRKRLLAQRSALGQDLVLEKSDKIAMRLLALPAWSNARTVMLYVSTRSEVQTRGLLEAAFSQGKRVCLPALENGAMAAGLVHSLQDISVGKNGFVSAGKIVSPKEIDLVVVPGVAFDLHGNRLGRGKGFYDAFLNTVGCPRVGVAFEQQIVSSLPVEPHDERVDKLVTERMVVDCNEGFIPTFGS